jgi:3'-5' exoribonuclease
VRTEKQRNQQASTSALPLKKLKHGDSIRRYLELRAMDIRKTRLGDQYLSLILGDASGGLPAKMWPDAVKRWGTDFRLGMIVKVDGRVENYQDSLQVVVEKMRKSEESEVPDMAAIIPSTRYDPEELFSELIDKAREIKTPAIAELTTGLLIAHKAELLVHPAAEVVHHAYRGGLLEHSVTVARKVDAIATLDTDINKDLAVAGAILHDIGKLDEIRPDGRSRTVEGRLLGHLLLGSRMIRDAAAALGVGNEPWITDLEHIVLSHHGAAEFGSPVNPLSREALLVHFMDNLDSRLKIVEEALESRDAEGFSPYNKYLEGRAYVGSILPTEDDEHA